MIKLIKIGLTDCIGSLAPILVWYFLGVFQDARFANVFMLTYAFQFVWMLTIKILTIGNIKVEKKYGYDNHAISLTGSIIGLIILVTIASIAWLNMDSILSYYGIADNDYKYFSLYGISFLILDYIIYVLKYLQQYHENNIKAAATCWTYYLGRMFSIIALAVIGVNNKTLMISSISFCTSMVTGLCVFNKELFEGYKVKFKIRESFKMAYGSLVSNISMFLLYSLGLGTLSGSEMFLSAYNAMSMASDTQWDILYSAIDTHTSIVTLKGNYEKEKKNLFKNAAIYALLLLSSSIIVLYIICVTLNIDKKMAFIMLFLEMSVLPMWGIRYVMTSWIECASPSKGMFYIGMIVYIVRISMTYLIKNQYALSWGVAYSAIVTTVVYSAYYYYKRKYYFKMTRKSDKDMGTQNN